MVRRALLQIGAVLNPSDKIAADLQTVNDWLLKQTAPRNFDGEDSKNILVQQEIAFAETCTVLEELGVHQPARLTAFVFYSKIRYFKNKHAKKEAK